MNDFELALTTYKTYYQLLRNFLELLQNSRLNKINAEEKKMDEKIGYRHVVVPFSVDHKLMETALQNTNVAITKKAAIEHDNRIQFSVTEMPRVHKEYLRLRNAKNQIQLNILKQNGINGVIINEFFYVDDIPYINPTIYIDEQDVEKASMIQDEALDRHYKTADPKDFEKIDAAYSQQLQEHTASLLNREGLYCYEGKGKILLYCQNPTKLEKIFLKKYSEKQYENKKLEENLKQLFPEEIRNKVEIADSLEKFKERKQELITEEFEPYPIPDENWKIETEYEDISLEYDFKRELSEDNAIITEDPNMEDQARDIPDEEIEQENFSEEELEFEREPDFEKNEKETENLEEPNAKIEELYTEEPDQIQDEERSSNFEQKQVIEEDFGIEREREIEKQEAENYIQEETKEEITELLDNTSESMQEEDFGIEREREQINVTEDILHEEQTVNADNEPFQENMEYTDFQSEEPEYSRKTEFVSESTMPAEQEISERMPLQNDIYQSVSEAESITPEVYVAEYSESPGYKNTVETISENSSDNLSQTEKIDTNQNQNQNQSLYPNDDNQNYNISQTNVESSYTDNQNIQHSLQEHSELSYDINDRHQVNTSDLSAHNIEETNNGRLDNHQHHTSSENNHQYETFNIPPYAEQKPQSSYYYDDRSAGQNVAAVKINSNTKSISSFNEDNKINKEEATIYDNRASFNDGKQYKAVLSLLEAQKKQFMEIVENQEAGKGYKEVKNAFSYLDATLGRAGVKQSFNKDMDKLTNLSQSEVVQRFLKNNGITEYNADAFDKVQNAINKSFAGTMYNQNVAKISPKTMSVDNAAIFGGIAKTDEERKILTQFIKKHSNAADKKKIVQKIGLGKSLSKSLQKQWRKAQSETTDSYLEVKSKAQEINAAKHTATKIMDAKFQLKGRHLKKKTLQYNIKISKANAKLGKMEYRAMETGTNAKKLQHEKAAIEKLKIRNEKNNTKKKAYEEKKAKKQAKADKKADAKVKGYSITRGEKKIQKLEKVSKYFEKRGNGKIQAFFQKKLDKAKKQQAKRAARKKALKEFFENLKKNKIGKAISTILRPINFISGTKQIVMMYLKTTIMALAKVFACLVIFLFIKYIITNAMYMAYGTGHLFSFSLSSIFEASDEEGEKEKLPMYKAYECLDAAERTWIENLYNITNGKKNGDDGVLLDNYDIINWNEELSGYPNCSYDATNNTIKYDALGIGLMSDITKVDGNIRVEFKNYNNPEKLSNIKDILAMTSVYLENGYEIDKDFDEDKIAEMKEYWMQETVDKQYEGFSKWFKKIFQKNTANPILKGLNEKDSETLAYNVYALSLFQGSHDVQIEFAGIDTYPLKPYIADEKLKSFLAAGRLTDENGELFVCPSEHGCQTADGFYFDNNGNILYQNKTKISSNLVYIEAGEHCLNHDKENSRCWDKTITKQPGTRTPIDFSKYPPKKAEAMHKQYPDGYITSPDREVVTYTHNCKGHRAFYCGGHIHIDATGIIHSIRLEALDEYADAQKDTQESFYENKTVFNENKLQELKNLPTEDIFEIDAKITHAYIPDTWGRWDAEHKSEAIARYSFNWTEIYNFPEVEDRSEVDVFRNFVERDYNWGDGGSSLEYGDYTGSDVEIICKIIGSHEGQEGSVNPWDYNAISIGKLQWHANRALNLLRDICRRNPVQANDILGNALYHEIMNPATNWANKYYDVNKNSDQLAIEKIRKLLYTQESYDAQDELYKKDVSVYMATAQSHGITDKAAVAYCCDIINQYGSIHSCHYDQIVSHGGTLDAAYEYTVNYTCLHGMNYSKYINRRSAVKAQCTAAYNSTKE